MTDAERVTELRARRSVWSRSTWLILAEPLLSFGVGAVVLGVAVTSTSSGQGTVLTGAACVALFRGGMEIRARRHLLLPPCVMRLSGVGVEVINELQRGRAAYARLAWSDVSEVVVSDGVVPLSGRPTQVVSVTPREPGAVSGDVSAMVRQRAALADTTPSAARTTMVFTRTEMVSELLAHVRVFHPEVLVRDGRSA